MKVVLFHTPMYNNVWQVQSVSFLIIITPSSSAPCVVVHKPSNSICEESFQLWSKAHMHCVLNFIIPGKSSAMQGFISWSKHVIFRCTISRCERSYNFNCLIASAVSALEFGHTILWRKRIYLDSTPLFLLHFVCWW